MAALLFLASASALVAPPLAGHSAVRTLPRAWPSLSLLEVEKSAVVARNRRRPLSNMRPLAAIKAGLARMNPFTRAWKKKAALLDATLTSRIWAEPATPIIERDLVECAIQTPNAV